MWLTRDLTIIHNLRPVISCYNVGKSSVLFGTVFELGAYSSIAFWKHFAFTLPLGIYVCIRPCIIIKVHTTNFTTCPIIKGLFGVKEFKIE